MGRTRAHVTDMLAFDRELGQLLAGRSLPQFLGDRVLCLAALLGPLEVLAQELS